MSKHRSWTNEQLAQAVAKSYSFRSVIIKLGLIPAGGNYLHVKRIAEELKLNITHFTGARWNVGVNRRQTNFGASLQTLLVDNSDFQSYKLKKRLFNAKIKKPICELCGWCTQASDGRIPVELDHINGNHKDNRLQNLRILCPNCHSLQLTHRGKNKKKK